MPPSTSPSRARPAPFQPYVHLTLDDEKPYEYSSPFALGSFGRSPASSILPGAPCVPSGSKDAAGKDSRQAGHQNAGDGTNAAGVKQDAASDPGYIPEKRWKALGLELPVPGTPSAASYGGTVPWLASLANLRSPWLRLHQEIVELSRYLTPSAEEVRDRCDAIQRVRRLVRSRWLGSRVSVFGSTVTGLYLPASDIDLVITGVGGTSAHDALLGLQLSLRRCSWARNVRFISSARVPIVKFEDAETNFHIDVSCNVGGGVATAKEVRKLLQLYPPLRPLSMLLKIFLQQRGLAEVYTGGVGSYCLLVMVAAFLKSHPSRLGMDKLLPADKKKRRKDLVPPSSAMPLETNVGVLLVDFLRLYGCDFSSSYTGVTHTGPTAFFPLDDDSIGRMWVRDETSFHVVDPCDASNDLGRSTRDSSYVTSEFRQAHMTLTAPSLPGETLLGRILRLDPALFVRQPKPWGEFDPGETAGRMIADQVGQLFDESDDDEAGQLFDESDGDEDGQPFGNRTATRARVKRGRDGAAARIKSQDTDSVSADVGLASGGAATRAGSHEFHALLFAQEMELSPAKQAGGRRASRPSGAGTEAGQSKDAIEGVLHGWKSVDQQNRSFDEHCLAQLAGEGRNARGGEEASAGSTPAPASASASSFEEHMEAAWEKMGSAPKKSKKSKAEKQPKNKSAPAQAPARPQHERTGFEPGGASPAPRQPRSIRGGPAWQAWKARPEGSREGRNGTGPRGRGRGPARGAGDGRGGSPPTMPTRSPTPGRKRGSAPRGRGKAFDR